MSDIAPWLVIIVLCVVSFAVGGWIRGIEEDSRDER